MCLHVLHCSLVCIYIGNFEAQLSSWLDGPIKVRYSLVFCIVLVTSTHFQGQASTARAQGSSGFG